MINIYWLKGRMGFLQNFVAGCIGTHVLLQHDIKKIFYIHKKKPLLTINVYNVSIDFSECHVLVNA
jgi:hypothetical protein